jgi:diguanylate cyclase (GGDEF)-like protein
VLLDIDHFKRVNDRYGHLTGDRALREVARVIATTVREDDIVGRYGGEEFCALLPGVFATDGRAVATRMLERIRQLEIVEVPEGVTASIGIVVMMPGDLGDDPMQAFDRMLASADAALYRAKNAGRDRLAIG